MEERNVLSANLFPGSVLEILAPCLPPGLSLALHACVSPLSSLRNETQAVHGPHAAPSMWVLILCLVF